MIFAHGLSRGDDRILRKFLKVLLLICILIGCACFIEACITEEHELDQYVQIESDISQWYLDGIGIRDAFISVESWRGDERDSENIIDIDYSKAMEIYQDRRETIVAVIDENIDVSLFVDTGLIWFNESEINNDAIDNDLNGYVDDINGWDFCNGSQNDNYNSKSTNHGNNIVGLLTGSNRVMNYVGLFKNTKCKVMCLNAVDEDGDVDNVIAAINYAENNGADICCLALSTYIHDECLMYEMKNSDMLFVVSAGNDGALLENDIIVYPAIYNFDNIITVADIRSDGQLSYTSNYGSNYVDIGVPGTDIICIANTNGCEYVSGTSVATAIMTGICALTRSDNLKELNALQLKEYICENARNLEGLEFGVQKGAIPNMYDYFYVDNLN